MTKTISKTAFHHLVFALFCALFGAVYEIFSFGVYSYFMIYAFLIPLLLGTFPLLALTIRENRYPDHTALAAWNSGIVVLTVGCIVQGVLAIYGTTNRLMVVYPLAGATLLAFGIIRYLKGPIGSVVME